MKNYQYPEMAYKPTGRIVTIDLFTLAELADEAQQRAYKDWMDSANFYDIDDYLNSTVDYDAVKTLEPIINTYDFDYDMNDRIYPLMANVTIPRDGHAPRMKNNGDCVSTDIAEAFNAHGHEMEEYAAMWYRVAFPEYDSPFYECDDQTSYDLMGLYEELYLKAFKRAAQDALDKWEELRENEREYLSSFEAFADEFYQGYECRTIDNAGRVFYSDTRKWYTRNGELFEQSEIYRECVSIVKCEVK